MAVSLATQLDLTNPDGGLLGAARSKWPGWVREVPRLRVVEDLLELPGWLRWAPGAAGDEVLHGLARLASPRSGDDVEAAGALAWAVLPGAALVAHRLRSLSPRIDEEVAAELWLQVRAFPWERQRKVAANIVLNTRREVMRDLGVAAHLREADPTWARSVPLGPDARVWNVLAADSPAPDPSAAGAAAEVTKLLAWAVAEGVIDERARDLLVALAAAATEVGVGRVGAGSAGLCSRQVSQVVAARRGMGASTIRRHAQVSLKALATAAAARVPA